MIVSQTPEGWRIIYHRAHALLAAQLAGQWRRKDAPPRLYETVAAISHHDDLEKEWESDNLTPAGTPKDFTMETETDYGVMRSHLEGALHRGRWVALLTSMHMARLNSANRGTSEEADQFLDEQIENQQRWIGDMDITKDDANSAYAFMQWCDRLSLILCQQELPADERALEISKGPDGQRYDILQYADQTVTVMPWCFEDDKFTVNVEATRLDQVKFDDNDSLIAALKTAPRQVLEWTFVKPTRATSDPLT